MSADATKATTSAHTWIEQLLACPRDHSALTVDGETITCAEGHEYPYVDGIPILVLDDVEPTQPGYWAKPEQVAEARRRTAEAPPLASGEEVDPYVAELIIGTHGNLYRKLAHGMSRYPIPDFPLPQGNGELLLDIGCNWGRWSLAAARAGYQPIGIDPSFEAISFAKRIAQQLGADTVRYVVADGRHLPFAQASLDVVFSYGVLQHFSKADVRVSLRAIKTALKPDGYSWIQMPNAFGLLSIARLAQRGFKEGKEFDVRYWRPGELRLAWAENLGPATLTTDGFFTLNPQKADLDLLPPYLRPVVLLSERLKAESGRRPVLTNLADSVNIRAVPAK
jgi:2-polyprenyl-3-methyl-5-hydroxy-6-metoxy-1,4-benzoquinol methylase